MAENVQYTGRLGLESREAGTLSAAVNAVVDTLDDFGHPAEKIEARAENTARLQCDHYLVTVRLRRVPLRRASKLPSSVMQPAALLELTLSPVFPGYCDQEISELLLAETLRRLLASLEATSVEWLDCGVALTCEQFLSVFAPEDRIAEQPAAAASATVARQLERTAAPKPRGRDCFTPVDQTAMVLDAHCDRAFQAAQARKAAAAADSAAARTRAGSQLMAGPPNRGWGGQLRASALAAFSLTGPRRLRFISHLLLLTALVLYLESAGMVQAARPLIP
ncbi:hypothetical protein KUW17_03720 [Leisingera aquaemixtae]|uniref:hypothetical protein n=1 Tax=Leisingera TaxID=191028 RepID=UPI001C96F589|nr:MULTISPECIES: hypothetical protein [Leisingera]MBY6065832.1 hypothetical protein [Leisingera aquaemixtae]MCB4455558.1 hypothetical protein [Leisingera sp. McT4-56]